MRDPSGAHWGSLTPAALGKHQHKDHRQSTVLYILVDKEIRFYRSIHVMVLGLLNLSIDSFSILIQYSHSFSLQCVKHSAKTSGLSVADSQKALDKRSVVSFHCLWALAYTIAGTPTVTAA